MRLLSSTSLALFALIGSTQAQYFSAGWTPGQPVHSEVPTATFASAPSQATGNAPAQTSSKPFKFSDLFDINNILTSEPVVALFDRFGVNITDKVQSVMQQSLWDERVTLLTDDNFNDLVVNEPMTPEEEKERAWIIVISVTAAKQEGVSKYLDQVFDSAHNLTLAAGDLPNIKWGRIDYLNVTYITTKWGVWQAPYLVIATERAQKLRFYRPHNIRLNEEAIREFLKVEGWQDSPIWSTSFAPGGSSEWIMDYQAKFLTFTYNWLVILPRWLLVLVSGSFASVLISFMHKSTPDTAPAPKPAPEAKAVPKPTVQAPSTPAAIAKSTRSKKAGTPAPPTDSEREASAPPAKRTSVRQRKAAKH